MYYLEKLGNEIAWHILNDYEKVKDKMSFDEFKNQKPIAEHTEKYLKDFLGDIVWEVNNSLDRQLDEKEENEQ